MYISKNRVQTKDSEELKKAIDELREDGTVMKILKKYVSEDDIKDYR